MVEESVLTQLQIEELLKKGPWSHWGFAQLTRPLSFDLYKAWLQEGYHGDMAYLERHGPDKERPESFRPGVRSAVVVARSYLPHPYEMSDFPLSSLNIAKYARGRDYHYSFSEELEELAKNLREVHPEEGFHCFTDSAPVMERDLAYRAGLGWFGKNSCLIDRKEGSFFLIGEIYTTLDLQGTVAEVKDFCGNCSRCIDSCPTGAILPGRRLDARRCISYLTIETPDVPEESLRSAMGEHLFGCDICQDVCPWNRKIIVRGALEEKEQALTRDQKVIELGWILTSSNKSLQRRFKSTPLARAAGNKLKRNALIYIANGKFHELVPQVQAYQDHPRLSDLANWCLEQLT